MSQTNLMKRTDSVSTRTIIVVTSASVAGIMVLGAVIYVLISCQTKRKRREADYSMRAITTPQLDFHRTAAYAHSGDSFIQSPPLTLPESRPTSAITITREPANTPLPVFSIHEPGLRPTTPAPGLTSYVVQASPNGGADPQESLMISRSRPAAPAYSNISLPLSQYSFVSGSAYGAEEPTIGSRMSTISASPRNTLVPPLQGRTSKLPLKSILKPTKSPSTPLTPPISPQSNRTAVPEPISLSALTLAPVDDNTSNTSALLRRRSQPNTFNLESNLDYERNGQPTALQPSLFRRRNSQPIVSYTERHSSHSSFSVIPSISEAPSNESPVVEMSSLTQPPLRSSPRPRRKPRPEPLRLRPRENYASIIYARARGPAPAALGPPKGPARGYTFPPTLVSVRDSLSIPRENNPNNQSGDNIFRNPFSATIPEERYPASQFQRTRPNVPSPTWSTFRDSPGWV